MNRKKLARLERREARGGDSESADRRQPLLLQALQWLELHEAAASDDAASVRWSLPRPRQAKSAS